VSRGTSGEAVGRLVKEKVGVTAGIVTTIASGTSEKRRKLARIRMSVLWHVVATIRHTPRFQPT